MKASEINVGDIVAVKVGGRIVKARIASKVNHYATRGGGFMGISHIGRSIGPRFTAENLSTGRMLGPFAVGRVRAKYDAP